MIAAGLFAFAAAWQPAQATTFVPQKFKCPVGGQKFTAEAIASSTSWGQRPDGRPYGTTPVWPVPECPDNGMPLFKEKFSRAELATLEPAVLSAEFQTMRKAETPWYRIWWLQQKVGASPYDLASMLLTASWEADDDPLRKQRYQNQFSEAALALVRDRKLGDDWFWLTFRAANALRELGRFGEMEAALQRIDQPELFPLDDDQREAARSLIGGLRVLASEENRRADPANLIPVSEAIFVCVERAETLTQSEAVACASDGVQQGIAQVEFEEDGRTYRGREAVSAILSRRSDFD